MEIALQPKKVALVLLWLVLALTLIHSVVPFFYFYLDDDEVFGLVEFFDFAVECNVPSLYSAFALLFCSLLLALVARIATRQGDGQVLYWAAMAAVFCFLAIDEGCPRSVSPPPPG